MRPAVVILLIAAHGAPALAAGKGPKASLEKRLESAKELYFEGRFQEAVFTLEDLLSGNDLGRNQRIDALKYQALSLFLLKLTAEAKSVWIEILKLDPKFEPDPVEMSPELLGYFRGITDEYKKSLPPPKTPGGDKGATGASGPSGASGPAGASSASGPTGPSQGPGTWENHERGCGVVLCLLPIGIGQFLNERYVKGVVFASLEAIFVGLNVALYWLNQSQLDAAGVPRDADAFNKNFIMQQVFFGMFAATVVAGIVDAYVFY